MPFQDIKRSIENQWQDGLLSGLHRYGLHLDVTRNGGYVPQVIDRAIKFAALHADKALCRISRKVQSSTSPWGAVDGLLSGLHRYGLHLNVTRNGGYGPRVFGLIFGILSLILALLGLILAILGLILAFLGLSLAMYTYIYIYIYTYIFVYISK